MPIQLDIRSGSHVPQLFLTRADERYSFTVGGEAALPLNFSCRRGDCGQCAVTPISGEFTALNAELPWRQGSQVLLCNSRAVGDVSIEIEHLPELEGIRHLRLPCKIVLLGKLSENVLEVLLRLPPNSGFRFVPGQHIRLTNRLKVTRSYSLAEPQSPDNLLRIHVRRVDGGAFSHYLFNEAAANDLLHLEGPSGTFFHRQLFAKKKLIFLATGTGIAPIYAMLLNLASAERPPSDITLIWGNRMQTDCYLDDALKALQLKLPFHYTCLYSREPLVDTDLRYVQNMLLAQDIKDAVVLAAGAPEMVRDARSHCLALGLPEANFVADPFTSS
jgi:CDP-4-dehydro-6-deoxyglucose reductase